MPSKKYSIRISLHSSYIPYKRIIVLILEYLYSLPFAVQEISKLILDTRNE